MDNDIFRTSIKLKEEKNQVDYSSNIVLFGSCFSENIGKKLDYYKFNASTNPYGILFNIAAIEKAIIECIDKKTYSENDLFYYNELWQSFNHHSDFSDVSSTRVLKKINNSIQKANNDLLEASHIIITLGTAWVYEKIDSKLVVANCHKVPQKEFNKKLLSIEEISNSIEKIKSLLLSFNSKINIIFTVSPVRHLKDGMLENSLSKAHLLSAIHKNLDQKTFYFPSYEIMIDDLRGYRFYNSDMVHPNEVAINYIWNSFKKTWISDHTLAIQKEVAIIQKGLQHKPFNPSSEAHIKFKKTLDLKIENLSKLRKIYF